MDVPSKSVFPYMDPQQASKKDRKRKDRSTDVSGKDGLSIEERKKRHKERKREKEGVIGGALRSPSLFRSLTCVKRCAYSSRCEDKKGKKKYNCCGYRWCTSCT
jgi:hypothetical protein